MTLQLNTYKNVEGGTVGRILSYYDLCDLPYGYNQADKDLDFSEFMTEEEAEEAEGRRQERELEEARRRGEEAWLLVRAANDPSVLTITEKAPTRAFSWLKVPTSLTFKTLC